FFDKSKAFSRRFQNSPPVAGQTAEIANLSLRQDLFAKNLLMTAQRNSYSGNSLFHTALSELTLDGCPTAGAYFAMRQRGSL
ncbi:MAG: hypothetical protein ABID54_13940, partial [Pseudomonadota bacterium]